MVYSTCILYLRNGRFVRETDFHVSYLEIEKWNIVI